MIFYSIIFALSLGGIVTIIYRNNAEFASFNFAVFMDDLVGDAKTFWQSHLRERSFVFLEKRIRGLRLKALKTEQMLFRAVHKLRGIKEKNGNSDGNDNGNGGGNDDSQINSD